jgi:hypothetical protein
MYACVVAEIVAQETGKVFIGETRPVVCVAFPLLTSPLAPAFGRSTTLTHSFLADVQELRRRERAA